MEMRASERELYEGRPSWRGLLSFFGAGVVLAVGGGMVFRVLDRIFGVGNVDFDTAGTDDSEFRFEWVNDPEKVVRLVDQAVEEARGSLPGQAPPGQSVS